MKKIVEYLQKLDFSETEANIYIILVQRGSMSVTELAEKAKLNRTATYAYISSLLNKGVIVKSTGKSNNVIANPPEHLHYLVEGKISTAHVLKEQLFPVVTALNASFMQTPNSKDSEITYYKSKASVMAIYDECLRSNMIRAYYAAEDLKEVFPNNQKRVDKEILARPDMRVYELIQKSPESVNIVQNSKMVLRHEYKFLPSDIKLTANDILLYDNKVAIINILDKNHVTGTVLHNKDYFNNSVQIFDLLWKLLPNSLML